MIDFILSFLITAAYMILLWRGWQIETLRAELDRMRQRLDAHQGTACPACGARERKEGQ